MLPWILVAAFLVFVVWLLFPKRRRALPEPEDDVTTPIDHAELEEAERELKQDKKARSVDEADEEEYWGPGAG